MKTASSLLRGSIFRTLDLGLLLGASFWITPYIVHSLGSRMYGFWTLLGSFMGYYGLLDFGLSSAAARYISRSLGENNIEDLNRVVNTAFFLFCLIGAAALALTGVAVLVCPRVIHDPAEAALFRRILVLLGVATAVGFPSRIFDGVLTSYLRYDVLSYISMGRTVLNTGAIYFALRAGGGIMSVAVVSFATSLLDYGASWAVCATLYREVSVFFLRFDRAKVRIMFDHSWKNFAAALSDVVRFRIDSVIVAAFLNVSLVTPYAIGARLVDGYGKLVNSSVGMMLPVYSRYDGLGDYDAIRSALLKMTKLSTLLSAYVGFSIIYYAKPLILRWMGPGFESSYGVTAILIAAYMIELPQSPGIQLLYGLSKHDAYAVLNAVEAVLNIVFSLILLRYYGMYGVVLGTALEILLIKLFVLPTYICAAASLPVRTYIFDTILVTQFKVALPMGIYFYAIREFVRPDYLRLLECGMVQTALFLPAAYFLILSPDERRLIGELASSVVKKASIKRDGVNAAA